jgi:hypothetical protein
MDTFLLDIFAVCLVCIFPGRVWLYSLFLKTVLYSVCYRLQRLPLFICNMYGSTHYIMIFLYYFDLQWYAYVGSRLMASLSCRFILSLLGNR